MSATLNDVAVTKGKVWVPACGLWWANVQLTKPLVLARGTTVTLKIGDVTGTCTVVSGGTHEASTGYRLVAGRGRWGKVIRKKSYLDDAGGPMSKPLADAASACGEAITDLPKTPLGSHFARRTAPASDVLNALAPRGWYADFAGVVHIGARPHVKYAGREPRVNVDTVMQSITLAVDDKIAGIVPGVIVDDFGPAVDVEYTVEPKRMTARVLCGPASTSRLGNALLASLPELARFKYFSPVEYRVVTQSGSRLNLQPVRSSSGFDDLQNVRMRPGIAGWKGQVMPGSLVLVQFIEGDPSRPVVTAHDDPDSEGWMPLTTELGGPAALGIALLGCTVQAGPFAGVITSASLRAKAPL